MQISIDINKTQEELIKLLQEENRLLQEESRLLREENAMLKAKILEIERRVGLNSRTSSKPPCSDGLSKAVRKPISLRGEGKAQGGQKGHQGKTLEQSSSPDQIIVHQVQNCSQCGCNLSQLPVASTIKRQVFDVIIQRNITEHRAEVKICSCKTRNIATFPQGIKAPVQIGESLRAIQVYLSTSHFIAKDRLSQLTQDLFGIPTSDTTLLDYESQLAENLQAFYQETLTHLLESQVKHADETGIRVGGKTEWMHTLCNPSLTYLKHQANRKVCIEGIKGTLVHDHYKSYLQLKVNHSFCNAHILRELKALSAYEKEPWAWKMTLLLQSMSHQKNKGSLQKETIARYKRIYDKIIEQGSYYHQQLLPLLKPKRGRTKRRIGENLLIRLRDFKSETLLFLTDERVPFTNNVAEQSLRMVKVKQKIAGCFRTLQGAKNFATIRSYIDTVRKNGGNIYQAIKLAFQQEVHLLDFLPNTSNFLPDLST